MLSTTSDVLGRILYSDNTNILTMLSAKAVLSNLYLLPSLVSVLPSSKKHRFQVALSYNKRKKLTVTKKAKLFCFEFSLFEFISCKGWLNLPRSIKWVSRTSRSFVVNSKLSSHNGSVALRQLNPIHVKKA